jgi:hypothetical protein
VDDPEFREEYAEADAEFALKFRIELLPAVRG